MCATLNPGKDNEQIEVVRPPQGSNPGDLVYIGEFPRDPVPEINPKKSQWDLVKDKCFTNQNGVACFDEVNVWKTDKGELKCGLKGAVVS